jgi:thiamine kinase-like enzyme
MTEQSGGGTRWLETVCNNFDEVIEALCDTPSTIIHGEYYPKNILLQDGLIYPVDWESTAIGSGEIDLVTLTEGWTPEATQKLELEYQQARWPDGPPHDFRRSLCAARIYIQFRWLGDQQARLPECACYLDVLRKYAQEMGLI